MSGLFTLIVFTVTLNGTMDVDRQVPHLSYDSCQQMSLEADKQHGEAWVDRSKCVQDDQAQSVIDYMNKVAAQTAVEGQQQEQQFLQGFGNAMANIGALPASSAPYNMQVTGTLNGREINRLMPVPAQDGFAPQALCEEARPKVIAQITAAGGDAAAICVPAQ